MGWCFYVFLNLFMGFRLGNNRAEGLRKLYSTKKTYLLHEPLLTTLERDDLDAWSSKSRYLPSSTQRTDVFKTSVGKGSIVISLILESKEIYPDLLWISNFLETVSRLSMTGLVKFMML